METIFSSHYSRTWGSSFHHNDCVYRNKCVTNDYYDFWLLAFAVWSCGWMLGCWIWGTWREREILITWITPSYVYQKAPTGGCRFFFAVFEALLRATRTHKKSSECLRTRRNVSRTKESCKLGNTECDSSLSSVEWSFGTSHRTTNNIFVYVTIISSFSS